MFLKTTSEFNPGITDSTFISELESSVETSETSHQTSSSLSTNQILQLY